MVKVKEILATEFTILKSRFQLQRARRDVEKDAVRHIVMLDSSVADRERNRTQDVAGTFWAYVVDVAGVGASEVA
jgi:hypothetical protein